MQSSPSPETGFGQCPISYRHHQGASPKENDKTYPGFIVGPALEVPCSSKVARAANVECYIDDTVKHCELYRKECVREPEPSQEGGPVTSTPLM